jgi:hypothetical protein
MNQNPDYLRSFCDDTYQSMRMLYDSKYCAQMAIVMYSSIDAMGLLDAPRSQTVATGVSFKNWVKTYLLVQNTFSFNEIDLWGARCAVLHTFTTESDLSNCGQAREIKYVMGVADPAVKLAYSEAASEIDNSVIAWVEELLVAFEKAQQSFLADFATKRSSDPMYEQRLSRLMQRNVWNPSQQNAA